MHDPARWMEFAQGDLDAARVLAGSPGTARYTVAFHAQQAAEKALKAALVTRKIDPPHTHDLRKLLDLCKTLTPELEALREDCVRLNGYSVESRYPAELLPDVTSAEAADSLVRAERVVARLRVLIKTP